MQPTRRLLKAFGQAVFENRPHLVEKGHLTPFITASEFAERRAHMLALMAPNSVALIPGNQVHFATPSVFYPFRQDPNFQYLTGFLEPGACLMLRKPKDPNAQPEQTLFVAEKDAWAEKWEGERTGTKLAVEKFGVDSALSNRRLRDTVTKAVREASTVYADLEPKATTRFGTFFSHELPALTSGTKVKEARPLVEALRAIKSENEIDCMRVAADASALAYNRAFQQEFATEKQLHSFLDFMFRHYGCDTDAYLAVVAGGPHALTIHYVRNDDVLRPGELVLVDAGGRYGGYCADISRTWPVDGKFTDPQRDLYEAVLNVEKACIEQCTASNNVTFGDIHRLSEKLMRTELANAGLDLPQNLVSEVYPHSIGHHLGLDVHDGPGFPADPLQPNMVITIEPGVYVPEDDRFPKHFQGIGIRIEDNVVIGKDSYEVLTSDTHKEIKDLER